MLCYGLTGKTGAGKSTVAAMLRDRGWFVIDGDVLARQITLPGAPALRQLCDAFGDDLLLADGTLDRKALVQRVNDVPHGVETLNAITHPAIDALVMRLADVMLAFPQMVLAVAVAGILGGGMGNAMLAMGITGWTLYARLARAQVISLKEEPYVQAARLSGFGGWRILTGTLLPNMLGPLLVTAATQIGVMMIGIAGLSFLGIGVIEPQAEWGSMINTSRAYMQLAPWAVLAPAAATVLTVMVFNCLGDCVRDALDVGVEG